MKKVIELIRVSTESQAADDKASIPAQRFINRKTANAYNLEIVRTIEMTDVSGAAVLHAPEMQTLLREIQSPEIHGVVAREFSRLMRPENYADYGILQAFVDSETMLYLPDGLIDFASKSGRLLGTIRAAMAGMERTEILERIWNSKEEKRRMGKFAQSANCLATGVSYTEERGFFYNDDSQKIKEAFRLFLSGVTSYSELEKRVGLSQYALRKMLRNHIYRGWRVIDEKRDMSAAGRRLSKNGRQGDRRKIKRASEDIIRKKVIDEPLISESDFNQVQILMDAKSKHHWKGKPDYESQFIYNGFLRCSLCGEIIYTKMPHKNRNVFYYVCKNKIQLKGCKSHYMNRDRVESELDLLFTEKLTSEKFLIEITSKLFTSDESQSKEVETVRLKNKKESLERRRERVLDTFFEGVISVMERDLKLKAIENETALIDDSLRRNSKPAFSPKQLTEVFSVFYEFAFLDRREKKCLLSTIAPEIRVADYFIEGIDISIPMLQDNFCGDVSIHTGKDSLRLQEQPKQGTSKT